jgi:hypothetical protein
VESKRYRDAHKATVEACEVNGAGYVRWTSLRGKRTLRGPFQDVVVAQRHIDYYARKHGWEVIADAE